MPYNSGNIWHQFYNGWANAFLKIASKCTFTWIPDKIIKIGSFQAFLGKELETSERIVK